eukprot:scaffold2.g7074.t1
MSLALCLLTGAHEVAAGDAGDWAPRRRSARSTAPERAGPLDDMVYRRGGAGQQSPFDALWPTSSGAKAESVDFLASVLFMTTDVVAAAVGTEIFESASCSIDSSCVPGWDANQRAVVQITHPVMGNFCSGTLIKGKDGAVYVLTANHCIQSIEASFVYPWSTYGVIFNYRLACNASFVDANDLRKFNQYLQGLRLAFADPKSDVALLRLLDDIPPEFNATTAGWDVCDTRVPFDWVDISDPAGDTEKYTKGVVNELIKGQIFYPDGSVGVNKGKCSGLDCAFFTGYPTRGDMQPGSSGSGLIHKDANLKLLSVDAKDPSGNGTAGHATGGGGGGGRCSQLLHQQLTGGNQYLLIIGEGIQATQLSRDANSTVVLTVTYAAQPHASPAPAFGSGSTSSSVARKAPARRQRRLLGGRRR